jgi:hypothetical protein
MITKEQREALKQINEGKKDVVIPSATPIKKVINESYEDAKTEFSEPFIVQNMQGTKVVAVQISKGKTYFMTPEFANSYIASLQKMIEQIGSDTDNEQVEEFANTLQTESMKKITRAIKKLDEAFMDNKNITFGFDKDRMVIRFNSELDEKNVEDLERVFGSSFDKGTKIVKLTGLSIK